MIKNKEVEKKEGSDLIAELISTINVEKGLSENTKIAYKNDIKLMIRWFAIQGINFIHANELEYKTIICFFKKREFKIEIIKSKTFINKALLSIFKRRELYKR